MFHIRIPIQVRIRFRGRSVGFLIRGRSRVIFKCGLKSLVSDAWSDSDSGFDSGSDSSSISGFGFVFGFEYGFGVFGFGCGVGFGSDSGSDCSGSEWGRFPNVI